MSLLEPKDVRTESRYLSQRQDAATYQYQPLNPNSLEIRLLTLEPAASWKDEIYCSLTIVNLEDLPLFEALSYTWDGGLNTELIQLSNIPYLITPNLESFLRHHRSDTEAIDLWVDAICINQSSNAEKSSQVGKMNMIYGVAGKLIVWLGPEADDSSLAMEALQLHGAGSPYDKMPILTGSVLTAVEKLLTRRWWSRIWIIQEVFWGGVGRKVQNMRVRCGTKEVWWVNLVVAAARMQSHANDQRQYYPAIESILRLDELRNQAEFMTNNAADEKMVIDLVAMHRHFRATDPRDKIYALMGMVFGEGRKPYTRIRIEYSMDTRELYVAFAMLALQTGPGLEILRHCRSPAVEMLPSWVPDWSLGAVEKPLPGRKIEVYKNEPWWLKHSPKKYEGEERGTSAFTEKGPGKGLRLNNGLSGDIQKTTITKSFADACPPEMLATIKELMANGRLIMVSTNDAKEDEIISKNDPKQCEASQERLVRRGERITRQTTEKALTACLVVGYAAACDTTSKITVNKITQTLEVEGILFDVINQIHEPFVKNVDAEWENSTHFMVAIGQCKQLSLLDYVGQDPYLSFEAREVAFWLTLFVGRIANNSGKEISIEKMPFHEWLPLIPTSWIPASPQVTVVNTGRLEVAEISKAMKLMFNELKSKFFADKGDFEIGMPALRMLNNLQPEEWTDEDCDYYTTRFQQLGSLWHHQPFDLYHRPFALPTVVPDPFGETRQTEDKIALLRSKNANFEGMIGSIDSIGPDGEPWEGRQWIEEALQKIVPIVPKCTLDPGFENFALGRRFFVTKKGYLGLGPRDAKVGDRVSVLLGSDVPFILRKRNGSSRGGWEMVGETYVHGIMKGEVIRKWKMGNVEIGKLVLY
jgi:hypothetical protein